MVSAPHPRLALARAPASRPPRILLAEDDEALRDALRETLAAEGYDVVTAASGRALDDALIEAVVQPGHRGYDLVVSDVRMPGASGLDVLERNYPRDPETPFLLITAFGDRVTHARASEFGVEVIDKPFEVEELLARVRALLAR
jgi:DNA-binding response OmpR family regulator